MDNEIAYFSLRKRSLDSGPNTGDYWSYPSLVKSGQHCEWLYVILSAVPMPGTKKTALFRPKGVIITKANGLEIIRKYDFIGGHDPFAGQPWDKPIAAFPHKGIMTLTYDELAQKEELLLRACIVAGKQFVDKETLPPAFAEQMLEIMHPVFLPYLKHLAPHFFKALGVEQNSNED
jgi:hypothetical protein